MSYVKRLTQKNIERGRHWLPFLPARNRDLVTLIPSLFCLGDDMAGIYGHTTCTPSQYDLLHKLLGRNPKIPINKQPYEVLIDSLIAVPRPSIVKPGRINILLIVVPKTGASMDAVSAKCLKVKDFFLDKDISLSTHILQGPFPPLILYEVKRVGIVLAGKHPENNVDDFPDYSFIAGDLPEFITSDATSLTMDEWNPYQTFLDEEVKDLVLNSKYPAHLRLTAVSPFILPYLPVLKRYDEDLNLDKILAVRHCLDALYSRFRPTREPMVEVRKAWGLDENPTPAAYTMEFPEALRIRESLVRLENNELPLFSWPPVTSWVLPKASFTNDGETWFITEADYFRHRYAWIVITWATIAGLIGHQTILRAPKALLLKRNAHGILQNLFQDISQGTDLIVPEDAHQGSIRIESGRFYFSDTSFAILNPGRKISFMLFEAIKKKALLDDSDLHQEK